MSLISGRDAELLPVEFLKKCIATYTKNNGKAPTTLVVNSKRIVDWEISCTIQGLKALNLEVVAGDYLNNNEIDLCMGVKK